MRRISFAPLCSIALGLGLMAGCAGFKGETKTAEGEDSTADKLYKIALGSFHQGMYSDAKVQLQRAVEADEAHGDAHYLRGLIALHEGKDMVEAVDGRVCLTDEAANLQRLRADELHRLARDQFTAAVDAYGDDEPGKGRALNSMSVVSLYFQEHKRAVEEAEGALGVQFYTERFSALANLGWAYYQGGDSVQAMTELRQAVMFNPEYCVGRYRLAQVYLDADMTEEALEQIEQVVADDRCPIQDAHRVAGVARMRLGRATDATAAFEACITLAPRSCLAVDCEQFLEVSASTAQRE